MAILITTEVQNQTKEGYDGMMLILESAVKKVKSFIMHAAYANAEGGWRVIEVWESANDSNQFFAKFVHPNLPPGIKPKRSFHDLHSLVKV